MGRVIKPGEIKTQASSMKQALAQENAAVQGVLPNISQFVGSDEFQGSAWSGLKEQLSDHQSVIQGLICANEDMIADSETLGASVGDEDLIEDEINQQIKNQESIVSASTSDIANWQINQNTNMISSANAIIQEMKGKIAEIDAIESATNSLYDSAAGLYAEVNAGIAALRAGWTGGGFAVGLVRNRSWKKTLDDRWAKRETINEKRAREYLRREGFGEDEIKSIEALGYAPTQMKAAWESLETKEDKQFFCHLVKGLADPDCYAKAFAIDPNDLSDNMTIILADYACHLLQLDGEGKGVTDESKQRLTDFNNALLNSEKMYYYRNEGGIEMESLLTYRDIYLEKLYAGTSLLMQADAAILAALDPSDAGYTAMYQEYEKKLGMTNLWATESILLEKLGSQYEEDHQISISNLTYYIHGDISFDLSHYSPGLCDMTTEEITTTLLQDESNLDNEWWMQKVKDLSEKKDQLLNNYITGAVSSAAIMALGAAVPEIAIIASLGNMVISGTAGSVAGLDSMASSTAGKMGIKGSNLVVQNAINYWNAVSSFESSLTKENFQRKMIWFGVGGKYKCSEGILEGGDGIAIAGIYEPEAIRQIGVWEKEGIAGWMEWEKDAKGKYPVAEDIMEWIRGPKGKLGSFE